MKQRSHGTIRGSQPTRLVSTIQHDESALCGHFAPLLESFHADGDAVVERDCFGQSAGQAMWKTINQLENTLFHSSLCHDLNCRVG